MTVTGWDKGEESESGSFTYYVNVEGGRVFLLMTIHVAGHEKDTTYCYCISESRKDDTFDHLSWKYLF